MLTFFRRGGAGQVILGAVVFAIILVFVMEFRPGRQGGGGISRDCAVKLHDSCIDRKEFFAAFGLAVPRTLTSKKVKQMGLKKSLMEGFVERELLLKEAERLGVSVSDEELDQELMAGRARVSLPMQQLSGLGYQLGLNEEMVRLLPVRSVQTDEFDLKIYERVVRNTTNRSTKEFRDMQRRELIAARMRDLVRARARVSEADAFLQWERESSKATARFARIDRDWFTKWVVDLSDAAVNDWAAKNEAAVNEAWKTAASSWKPECPLVSEIVAPIEEEAGDVSKAEARKKVEDALARVKKGESFEGVAKDVSQGASKFLGGDIGCVNEGYGPGSTELLDALKNMKPGEVSPVVESKRGFHVLKLRGRVAEKDLEKAGKLTMARRAAAGVLATGMAKEFGDAVIQKVKAGATLEQAVDELTLEYAKKGPAQKPKPAAAAPVAGGAPAKKDDLPALADPIKPRVEESVAFNVLGTPVDDAERTEAAGAKVFELSKPNEVVPKPIKTANGYAVLQLKEKTLAKKEDFAKDRLAYMRNLREAKGTDAVNRYVAALRAKVKDKIELDSRLLEEPADESPGDG